MNARNERIKGWKKIRQEQRKLKAKERQEQYLNLSAGGRIKRVTSRRGNSIKELERLYQRG